MDSTNSIVSISELQEGWKNFIAANTLDTTKIRPVVAASWERCRSSKLDPYENSNYSIERTELAQRINNNQRLIKIARPFMENIYRFVQGSGFQIVLADEEGYILDVIGDPSILERSKMVHLIPGGNWNEEIKGTNAIGTAIVEKAPVQIYAMEHYLRDNHFLTCSAAPIFDPDGRLCGVLDVSGDFRYANPHTLGMVVAAVTAIESQLRLRKATSSLYFAYKYSNTIMESMAEGLLSIDNNGIITSINSMGSKILELKPEECIGRTVQSVFGQPLPLLDIVKSGGSYEDKEVKISLHGREKLVLSTATPLINETGETIGAVAVLREPKTTPKELTSIPKVGKAKYTFENIIGESKLLKEAVKLAQKSAHTIAPVLLQGESGTGKELFAQAIHNYGPAKERPFVAINCAAIPKELIESELFGYEEGAFTGAKKGGHPGKFEIANKGTIFLDEIGDMPLETQAKLLRVLQEKTVTRVGGHKEIPVDVRIIAATHRDLTKAVEEGKFRLDLFYRINVIPICIPPLRERGEDVVLLAKHLIEKLAFKMKQPIVNIRPDFFDALKSYHWPGNIRELENVLERAIMLSEEGCLGMEQLPQNILDSCQKTPELNGKQPETPVLSLKETEKQAIIAALQACKGNITKAAEKLGIGRNTLYRKIKEYEIVFNFDTDE
jgi:transcriptional regulator of acetoin/glycerol metabolism